MKAAMRRAKWFVLGLALLSVGCAGSKYAAGYEGIAKVVKINGSFAGQFKAIDEGKRASLVRVAHSLEEGKKLLAGWDVTSERLVMAVEGTHASAQLTRDKIEEIRKGIRDKHELPKWVAFAVRLGLDLKALLEASGVHLEGL